MVIILYSATIQVIISARSFLPWVMSPEENLKFAELIVNFSSPIGIFFLLKIDTYKHGVHDKTMNKRQSYIHVCITSFSSISKYFSLLTLFTMYLLVIHVTRRC